MTLAVMTLGDVTGAAERDRFIERFIGAGAALRRGERSSSPPSSGYAQTVLSVALQRRSDLFLVVDRDEIVARALVSQSFAREGAAGLGLFEAAPDSVQSAGAAVIAASSSWSVANGLPEIFAPLDVNTWLAYRFLERPEVQRTAPAMYSWEPAQPQEYLDLFLEQGFREAERFHTIGMENKSTVGLTDAVRYTARARIAAEAAGYRFQRLGTTSDIENLMDEIHPLCMESFRDNFLFEPIPLEMFRRLHVSAAATRDCSLSHVMRNAAGAVTGFVFVFIDRGDVIIKTIAVGREERGQQLSTALMHVVLAEAHARGLTTIVSALVRRGNTSEFLSQRHMHEDVSTWQREYVLLHKRVG